jgi:hypothetical protein
MTISVAAKTTWNFLRSYFDKAPAPLWLTRFFQIDQGSYYNGEKVTIDLQRSGRKISPVIELCTGYHNSTMDEWQNNQMIAPAHMESFQVKACDQMTRRPGQSPFEDPNFQSNAMQRAMQGGLLVQDMIFRSVELQAAQTFETGVVTLKDEYGVDAYTITWGAKASHFPDASVAWNGVSPDIVGDLWGLVRVIKSDYHKSPKVSWWGHRAFAAAMADDTFMANFERRRAEQGTIVRLREDGFGGTYHGFVKVGDVELDIWTYDGEYEQLDSPYADIPYINPDKVTIFTDGARMQATYGAIPKIVEPDRRAVPFLPNSIVSSKQGIRLSTNVWIEPNNLAVNIGFGTRPLLIPVAIDSWGTIDAGTEPEA